MCLYTIRVEVVSIATDLNANVNLKGNSIKNESTIVPFGITSLEMIV